MAIFNNLTRQRTADASTSQSSNLKPLDEKKSCPTASLSATTGPQRYKLEMLYKPADSVKCCPITYVYDPVPNVPLFIRPRITRNVSSASRPNSAIDLNSCELDAESACLPYRSNLYHFRASRYRDAILKETKNLLNLLANDQNSLDVEVGQGITLARLAEKELRPGIEDRMALATTYMFPGADEQKIRDITCFIILYFIFDDKVEETPDCALHILREHFFRHFQAQDIAHQQTGPLQSHMDSIHRSIEANDCIAGDGGREMLAALRSAFKKVHPKKRFQNIEEYLNFRRLNVAASFIIAAAKYSIGSSIDTSSTRFAAFLRLIGDHLGIVNDIASYDKELRAIQLGDTEDMINIVDVFKNLVSLPDTAAAKAIAYTYQLQVEAWIVDEIDYLRKSGLSDEGWWFIEAVILAATGNVFFCMVTSRYGGENARIPS